MVAGRDRDAGGLGFAADEAGALQEENNMIHIKSILAGVLAVLGTLLLHYLTVLARNYWLLWRSNAYMGFDYGLAFRSAMFWLVVTLVFAAGYVWEFRRLSR